MRTTRIPVQLKNSHEANGSSLCEALALGQRAPEGCNLVVAAES